MAPSGRPPKRPLEHDTNVRTKRGRSEYVKRKQNLKLNESQNQANHHKCVVRGNGYIVFVVFF